MSQVYSTEPPTTGRVIFHTSHGPFDVHLWCTECPTTCRMFLQRCLDGYYDGHMPFHRVMANYLIQTGSVAGRIGGASRNANNNGATNNATSILDAKTQTQASLEKATFQYLTKSKSSSSSRGGGSKSEDQTSKAPALELSSRIKFNHRGQVAMATTIHHPNAANAGGGDTEDDAAEANARLEGQFFVTLEEAPHLNGQHVIFGSVKGPTMFNALRMSQVEVEEDSSIPFDMYNSCYIERVELKEIPPSMTELLVHDTPASKLPWLQLSSSHNNGNGDDAVKKRKQKRKAVKDLNVLSFGGQDDMEDEDEDEDDDNGGNGGGSGSGRKAPLLLSSSLASSSEQKKTRKKGKQETTHKRKDPDERVDDKKKKENQASTNAGAGAGDSDTDDESVTEAPTTKDLHSFSQQMRREMEQKRSALNMTSTFTTTTTTTTAGEVLVPALDADADADATHSASIPSRHEQVQAQVPAPEVPAPEQLSLIEQRRALFLQKYSQNSKKKQPKRNRDEDTMSKLLAFQSNHFLKEAAASGQRQRQRERETPKLDDNSLAARMLHKVQKEENEKRLKTQDNIAKSYRGQVLFENDDDDDMNAEEDAGDWMHTRFTARKHMDNDNDYSAVNYTQDDYVVKESASNNNKASRHNTLSSSSRQSSTSTHRSRHHNHHHHSHHGSSKKGAREHKR
jgi:peptidyl-prolyl cis-trans isomerase SDCCAG10